MEGRGGEGRVPRGLNRNHTHIITHLNAAIVVSKPHSCNLGVLSCPI